MSRNALWYSLLPGEPESAGAVLEALWFQVFDRGMVECAFDAKASFLRCIPTTDAYRQALHDYFAYACAGQPVDPLERAVALDFLEEMVADVAPLWAIEADDPDVLTTGIYSYMPENPADDSWMADAPADEQDWFRVCDLIQLLREYDDLSVAEAALTCMLDEGMPRPMANYRMRAVIAPNLGISERELEILGVTGCQTAIHVPDDWSRADTLADDGLFDDLNELAIRVHDDDGQPELDQLSLRVDGRQAELRVQGLRPSRRRIDTYLDLFRLADDSCHVRIATDGRVRFVRTAPGTWGHRASLDDVASAWADLLGVKLSPYAQIEYEHVTEIDDN